MSMVKIMNRNMIGDQIFKIYRFLPHCLINRAIETVNIKNKFDYNNQSDISIIATNCIGGELYHILGLKFNSPFINISMKRSEFARMAELLPEYMDCDIRVQKDDGGTSESLAMNS